VALAGLAAGLALVTLAGHVVEVPTLATMIGLGVGIDYALFVVTRHQEQLRAGMALEDSVARATATSGAVVFAGGTVVIALGALALAGIPMVAALGYTAAIVVVVAVLAALTLLPAILAALGPKVNALRIRRPVGAEGSRGWRQAAEAIARHPAACLTAGLGALCSWPRRPARCTSARPTRATRPEAPRSGGCSTSWPRGSRPEATRRSRSCSPTCRPTTSSRSSRSWTRSRPTRASHSSARPC
jgi:RND superfamily putative drug exporter